MFPYPEHPESRLLQEPTEHTIFFIPVPGPA
jgi:hypothetical protein